MLEGSLPRRGGLHPQGNPERIVVVEEQPVVALHKHDDSRLLPSDPPLLWRAHPCQGHHRQQRRRGNVKKGFRFQGERGSAGTLTISAKCGVGFRMRQYACTLQGILLLGSQGAGVFMCDTDEVRIPFHLNKSILPLPPPPLGIGSFFSLSRGPPPRQPLSFWGEG